MNGGHEQATSCALGSESQVPAETDIGVEGFYQTVQNTDVKLFIMSVQLRFPRRSAIFECLINCNLEHELIYKSFFFNKSKINESKELLYQFSKCNFQTDTFEIAAVSLGELKSCVIGHDGTASGEGWKCECVRVRENEGEAVCFPCNKLVFLEYCIFLYMYIMCNAESYFAI